jgi:hypothetical protein
MFLTIVVAGIVGTAYMTLGMYLLAGITGDHFKVVKVLGTMLTFQTTDDSALSDRKSAIWTGIVTHYFVGISFSFLYAWLWKKDIIEMNFLHATWLGLLNGIIGAIVWRIFIGVHPRPPQLPISQYLIAIALGHVLFAHGIYATHLLMSGN